MLCLVRGKWSSVIITGVSNKKHPICPSHIKNNRNLVAIFEAVGMLSGSLLVY